MYTNNNHCSGVGMMKIRKRRWTYGKQNFPVFICRQYDIWCEVGNWMRTNNVEYDLLSSGALGYEFFIRSNYGWFLLNYADKIVQEVR